MLTAFRWADSHPQVRVIIQTGQGKFFTTGKTSLLVPVLLPCTTTI